jgi:hypothetical protein
VTLWTTACYAAPLVYLATLYFVEVRNLQTGGGTPISIWNGYRATLAWTLGGPNDASLQTVTAALCIAGLFAGLVLVFRERPDLSIFFAAAIVVMPLAMALLEHGTLHYVRYFIVTLGFLLLLFGRILGWVYARGTFGKIACGAFCSLFLAVNGWDLAGLIKYGRSHISEAVQFMAEHSKESFVVSFGGDQDFRIHFVLAFYWREMMPGQAMVYCDHEQWPTNGPDWVIFHRESFRQPVPRVRRFIDKFDNPYELVRIFPTAPLSGLHWFIYQKTNS